MTLVVYLLPIPGFTFGTVRFLQVTLGPITHKNSLCLTFHRGSKRVKNSKHGNAKMPQIPSDLSDHMCSRPPDRRRRDVFGVANNTLFPEGGGRGNTTSGTGDNTTDSVPPIKEYPFSEGKSTTEFLEIPHLQPFTVYRIDLHACNEEVGHCSVGAFVYSRTKPAGSKPTLTRWGANYTCSLSSFQIRFPNKDVCVCVFPSGSGRHPWEGDV